MFRINDCQFTDKISNKKQGKSCSTDECLFMARALKYYSGFEKFWKAIGAMEAQQFGESVVLDKNGQHKNQDGYDSEDEDTDEWTGEIENDEFHKIDEEKDADDDFFGCDVESQKMPEKDEFEQEAEQDIKGFMTWFIRKDEDVSKPSRETNDDYPKGTLIENHGKTPKKFVFNSVSTDHKKYKCKKFSL